MAMRLLLALALLPVLNAAAAELAWRAQPDMSTARSGASATVLPGSHEVLVAGGMGPDRHPLASTEIWNGRGWRPGPPLRYPRAGHSALRLVDGRVLVVGGGVAEAETYADGQWQSAGSLPVTLVDQVAVALRDTEVLVTGGSGKSGPQPLLNRRSFLFDPNSSTWRESEPTLNTHAGARAALLSDGQVLLAGGAGPGGPSTELYNLRGAWTATGDMVINRTQFALVPLGDGTVLAAGGLESVTQLPSQLRSAEVYEPSRGTWRAVAPMRLTRLAPAFAALSDGSALVVSGRSGEQYEYSTEGWRWLPGLSSDHTGGTLVAVTGDRALVVGGRAGAAADLLQPAAPTVPVPGQGEVNPATAALGGLAGLLLVLVAIQAAWRRRSPYAEAQR